MLWMMIINLIYPDNTYGFLFTIIIFNFNPCPKIHFACLLWRKIDNT